MHNSMSNYSGLKSSDYFAWASWVEFCKLEAEAAAILARIFRGRDEVV